MRRFRRVTKWLELRSNVPTAHGMVPPLQWLDDEKHRHEGHGIKARVVQNELPKYPTAALEVER